MCSVSAGAGSAGSGAGVTGLYVWGLYSAYLHTTIGALVGSLIGAPVRIQHGIIQTDTKQLPSDSRLYEAW